MKSKQREKRSIQINTTDAAYKKVIDVLNLFIQHDTFNIIEELAWHYPLTEQELNVAPEPLQKLLDLNLVIKRKGLYDLNRKKITDVNNSLKTIGKYARK